MELDLGILVERGGPHAPAGLMVDASRSLAPPPRDQEPTGFCNVQDGGRGGGRHSSSSYTPLLPIQLISHIWHVEACFVCCVRKKMFCVPCVCWYVEILCTGILYCSTPSVTTRLLYVCRWREVANNPCHHRPLLVLVPPSEGFSTHGYPARVGGVRRADDPVHGPRHRLAHGRSPPTPQRDGETRRSGRPHGGCPPDAHRSAGLPPHADETKGFGLI